MASSRQIGGITESISSSSKVYTVKYFVLDSDLDKYVPEIKSTASWAPGDCTVTEYSKSRQGEKHWELSISASPRATGYGVSDSDDLNDQVEKSYEVGEIRFPKEWWGIRIATEDDEDDGILNIDGEECKRGDKLYPKATSSSEGEADYTESPFTKTPAADASLIEQTVSTRIFTCTFYSPRSIGYISDFVGVNGGFTGKCRPCDSHTVGRWKALDQRLDTRRDSEGNVWTAVTRRMIQAPCSLKWSADKNGGTWSW